MNSLIFPSYVQKGDRVIILSPSSKMSSYAFCNTLLESPKYSLQNVYRALSVMAEESDHIQEELYRNSNFVHDINSKVLYYDCTNYYFELSSRARKWGAILTSITQHVRSVLNNEDARRMLSDCGYIKLLNQAPDDANDIARLLHISDEEKRYIENAEVGSGLLIADKVVVPFNNTFPQDTELFRLMDTNPNRKK